MNKIIITTEDTCDLTPELCKQYNIATIGLNLIVDEVEYNSQSNPISTENFYKAMRADKKVSTSLVNEFDALAFFENLLKQDYDIVHIGFSKNLSGTYNNIINASEQLKQTYGDRIRVVDSLSASMGEGLIAVMASIYNDGTKSLDEIAEYALNVSKQMSHLFIVDSLKYLARTGRISKLTAGIGTLLQIKPVLHADDEGRLTNIQKVISRKKSINVLADKVISSKNNLSDIVFIAHADCIDDANLLASLIEKGLSIKPIISNIGPIVGSHAGPGTLAIFFTSDTRQ